MPDSIRPVPSDPTGDQVLAMLDLRSQDWLLSAPGDYQTGAVEAMRNDGTDYQRLVALEWPARPNHGTETTTVRLLISPEDALGLAEMLAHTARWLMAAERLGR